MQYEVIQGTNGSYRLRCAVPGFTKDQIDCSFKDGWLFISAEKERQPSLIAGSGLVSKVSEKFRLGTEYKIDIATLQDGILEVLFSKNLEANGTRITVL